MGAAAPLRRKGEAVLTSAAGTLCSDVGSYAQLVLVSGAGPGLAEGCVMKQQGFGAWIDKATSRPSLVAVLGIPCREVFGQVK